MDKPSNNKQNGKNNVIHIDMEFLEFMKKVVRVPKKAIREKKKTK